VIDGEGLERDHRDLFRLKPLKAAKVSEISEATALSSVAARDRVNFHIGHPIQDARLTSLFSRIVLGLGISPSSSTAGPADPTLDELGWNEDRRSLLEFVGSTIRKSVPYLPVGGSTAREPIDLLVYFHDWLTNSQQEPLEYDLGTESGKRECTLASGGIRECLRVLLHALSRHLVRSPADILTFHLDLRDHGGRFPNLEFLALSDDDALLAGEIEEHLAKATAAPCYLILGKVPREETRRELRRLGLRYSLFFVEVNGALNHLSLAREAKLKDKVIRYITPDVLSPHLSELSPVFVAGNSEYLKTLDAVHFQLKGTPASAEVELLTFLLKPSPGKKDVAGRPGTDPGHSPEGPVPPLRTGMAFLNLSRSVAGMISRLIESKSASLDDRFVSRLEQGNLLAGKYLEGPAVPFVRLDSFSNLSSEEILDSLLLNLNSRPWIGELVDNFLISFIRHHPEYALKDSIAVSGSSRTGLSLLGFHCGIDDVVTCDHGWTYEHCFPSVSAVPLSDDLDLDTDGIVETVRRKLALDPGWNRHGAFVLNNPHNASGRVFDEGKLAFLIEWLLERKVFVIDDLSYQDLAPTIERRRVKTAQQIARELVRNGSVVAERMKYVLTIHSLSKTDCTAGARMAVAHIPHPAIKETFARRMDQVKPNIMAILIAYLFYRNGHEEVQAFWGLRDRLFFERMNAIERALEELPPGRNPYAVRITAPQGSMYPHMTIRDLPSGLSLDWLSSELAAQGIGLVPLTTFARTAKGFESARKTFRLTLGGKDGPEELYRKTRRTLIDLNRLIAEESANYSRRMFTRTSRLPGAAGRFPDALGRWHAVSAMILETAERRFRDESGLFASSPGPESQAGGFARDFLPERVRMFDRRFKDDLGIADAALSLAELRQGRALTDLLEQELYKEGLDRREALFRHRIFDRTVHPTQMYSIRVDRLIDRTIDAVMRGRVPSKELIGGISEALVKEFFGLNVAINSAEEADELVCDLRSMIAAEEYLRFNTSDHFPSFLSFWGDWDGSTRPSGQGHRLVAAVLLENVNRLSDLLSTCLRTDGSIRIDEKLSGELRALPAGISRFWKLLNEITSLTNQLEKRYRSVLPFHVETGRARRLGMRLHLAKDPMHSQWQHNDRLEKKMLELRTQRRAQLEKYFSLNKRLRKALYGLLPKIRDNRQDKDLALVAGLYRNLLNRFALTPRIHQKMITSRDPFPIDTTVHNIVEINEISGAYGNPGMILALQVSISTDPDSLIALDRKLAAERERSLREARGGDLPPVWIVPLFEDAAAVRDIGHYMDRVWEYSIQSRRLGQETKERFSEMIAELFIAGSDLSQSVGQPAAAELFKEAKQTAIRWLAEKGIVERVRIKLGSGESMQRQGGYYSPVAGMPAFLATQENRQRLIQALNDSTRKSTEYATSPLLGVLSGGDLRTFQSNLAEKLRALPVEDRARLFHHLREAQSFHEREILRAAEPLLETRLKFGARGYQELERLTVGKKSEPYRKFTEIVTRNFRTILYGTEEDAVGIHVLSYFISRATPNLRDRPAVRPSRSPGDAAGRGVLERISGTIPLARHGSLLRAIGHNQAQTMILGINQLTTGLFRSLREVEGTGFHEDEISSLVGDVILPRLPVYEILHSLRIYHDPGLKFLGLAEKAYPPGNSAWLFLREDLDSMAPFLVALQKELLRRHGVDVGEFFDGDGFLPALLPTLRPDLAVLLQRDLFNTDMNLLMSGAAGEIDGGWRRAVEELLEIPVKVKFWRTKIWGILEKPILQQVESFVGLSRALCSLSRGLETAGNIFPAGAERSLIRTNWTDLLKGSIDDSMRQFLIASVQFLSRLPGNRLEMPIDVIRALKDVERILVIDKQALSREEQDMLRYGILQIARICGENG
jgi:aspartate/methionine/tyrosine aminotransferase